MNFNFNVILAAFRQFGSHLRKPLTKAGLMMHLKPIQEFRDLVFTNYVPDAFRRAHYNSQKIVLEGILNKEFATVFRQPPLVSDIWIENHTLNNIGQVFFANNAENSPVYIGNNDEPPPLYLANALEYFPDFDFTVWVPLAVYNSLAPTDPERTSIIQAQVDKYKVFPIKNDILTY